VIDARPEDMNRVDFIRPNGEPAMRSIADYRQLNDALFHAGLNSGSEFEYMDRANALHFYVVDVEMDNQGIRSYSLGVRSMDAAGPHARGVAVVVPTGPATRDVYNFQLVNTGFARPVGRSLHLQDTGRYLNHDIYRLSVSVEGAGWTAGLKNALAAVEFGKSAVVPVYVTPGTAARAIIRLTTTSESDRTKFSTASYTITR
jgi:hypothetical protein